MSEHFKPLILLSLFGIMLIVMAACSVFENEESSDGYAETSRRYQRGTDVDGISCDSRERDGNTL